MIYPLDIFLHIDLNGIRIHYIFAGRPYLRFLNLNASVRLSTLKILHPVLLYSNSKYSKFQEWCNF